MTIQEMKKEKFRVERAILALIQEFEDKSAVRVDAVMINKTEMSSMSGVEYFTDKINLEVSL